MINLNGTKIGPGNPPYIIAECCNNFQGSMDIATAMIAEAKRCGADAVKFQYRRGTPNRIQLGQLAILRDIALNHGIEFLCTAFDPIGSDDINQLVNAHKIGSAEVTDLEFVRHVAKHGKPVFCSTGATTEAQVKAALEVLGDVDYAALQCTSIYPTPPQFVRLSAMLQFSFGAPAIGYSDHTGKLEYPIAAMALGADVIEVHFTLSKALPGPDQVCSHEPQALKAICDFARTRHLALAGGKECFPEEMEKISQFRKPLADAVGGVAMDAMGWAP